MNQRKNKLYAWAYLFLLPQLIAFGVFTLYPIIMSYVYALYDWSGFGPLQKFVGLANFHSILQDKAFWNAFGNNLFYIFWITVLALPLTLAAAMLVNLTFLKGRVVYRTLLFLPVVTTTAIVGLVLKFIFGNEHALFNEILMAIGLIREPVGWLAGPGTAMGVLIGSGVWKIFGTIMIYWLAGLQSLPEEIYEAAKIDGAGFWGSVRYLTLPLLVPIGTVILLLTVMNGIHVFDLASTLTGGGPFFATDMMDLYIYRYAFESGGFPQLGHASAAGIIFGLTIFGISLILGGAKQLAGRRTKRTN
ncbi:carbohydrate ABC transporter permease [Paenibacillus sp. S150]|uniref:carbohydrate ABC transporter permease n=1 Tax=Paenibacillus sp. S150 TaxID=2749826 RepID=UPI001C589334|nr:sugar ABC transporter permease [Paenibacillus sp. S150]MBW4079908.1 sugar ABC transporter permease [Paenibacillus sp. S150]